MMTWKRSLISFLLLIVYTVGFGHNLIPHCHSDEIAFENGFDSNHLNCHKHATAESLDDDDVLHENHLDDSLFDYFLCLLSELEHEDNGLVHQNLSEVQTKNISFSNFPQLLPEDAYSWNFPSIILNENIEYKTVGNTLPHLFLESSPHRGPPSES